MLRRWSVAGVRAELGALEASVERGHAALGRLNASAGDGASGAADQWSPRMIDGMRLVLGATVLSALAALASLATLAALTL
jgi:hypothetical protein